MADAHLVINGRIIGLDDNGDGTFSLMTTGSGGGGGGGDASAANQDEQTALLTTLTGAIVTVGDAASITAKGVPPTAIRDDALSALSDAEGDEVRLRVDGNGALWVQLAGALAAATDAVHLGGSASASDGPSRYKTLDLDETEEEIKATAGNLYGIIVANTHASAWRYLKLYNATAANVTVGTTTPVETIALPPSSLAHLPMNLGDRFSTAITAAATTGVADNDTGAPGANEVVATFFYL